MRLESVFWVSLSWWF